MEDNWKVKIEPAAFIIFTQPLRSDRIWLKLNF